MIITTPRKSTFDTEKPARSNIVMVLNKFGNQVMDTLKLTGNFSTVEMMDGEQLAMIEVEHSFGISEVSEDYLWQD